MTLIVTRRIIGLALLIASTLMAACGPHSSNPSTESLTIYQDAPALKPLDLGAPGNSPGDAYYFSAALHSSPGGPVTGEVFGSKTLIKVAAEANPNSEKRATLLVFTFGGGPDQIIAFGAGDYPPTEAEFNAGQPVVRDFGRNRQIHGRAWPIDQYAKYERFIYPGVYACEVSGGAVPMSNSCLPGKVRLVGATAHENKAGIESNWLSVDRAVGQVIDSNPS